MVTMKGTLVVHPYWHSMLFSLVEIQLCFTESYCLHLHSQNISQANSQQEADGMQSEQLVKNGV